MATGCALDTDSLGVLEVGNVVRVVEVSGAGRWTGGERVLRLRCDDPLELADPLRPFTAKWYGQAPVTSVLRPCTACWLVTHDGCVCAVQRRASEGNHRH